MRKWDGKPASNVEAGVRELQGKAMTKGNSSKKIVTSFSSGQLSRQSREFTLASDPLEGTSKLFLQQVSSKFSDQD